MNADVLSRWPRQPKPTCPEIRCPVPEMAGGGLALVAFVIALAAIAWQLFH